MKQQVTIGFVGAGNMASALMDGLIRGHIEPTDLYAYDANDVQMQVARAKGIQTRASIAVLAQAVDVLVLAVKPNVMQDVLTDLQSLEKLPAVLSIAAGWTHAMLASHLPNAKGIARMMPNTPAKVGEGVMVFASEATMDAEMFEATKVAFSTCGLVIEAPEALFDAITALSGSGPAFVYMFIEAMADAAVQNGLPRDMAYALAAQTITGAGKMVLETKMHPGVLKDAVTSPGGTTIAGVYALEKAGLRAAVMDGINAAANKAAEMRK